MKLLMENWRKFLNERVETEITDECLYHLPGDEYHSLIIYRPDPEDPDGVQLIGGLSLEKTMGKCITDESGKGTYAVGSIYVEPDLQGQGYSKTLYGIAFHLANKEGFGVTSDQLSSTSWMAKDRAWSKLLKNPSLDDRETQAGNDVFDYNNSTPDNMDDCEEPDDAPATNKSWIMSDHSKYGPAYTTAVKNHGEFVSNMTKADKTYFHDRLDDWSSQGFEAAYDLMKRNKPVGE